MRGTAEGSAQAVTWESSAAAVQARQGEYSAHLTE